MPDTSVSVTNKARKQRPLSPHLQVYKPQLTSILSIGHRATGILLSLGLLLFAWWIVALASGPEAFAHVQAFFGSFLGLAVLAGCTFALFFHTATGVRHLFWDAGVGFSIEATYRSGYGVVAFAVLATAIVFAICLEWL